MAEVTVKQLAETVGVPAERLLSQMKDAGLPHTAENEMVSEEQKQALLAHLNQVGERFPLCSAEWLREVDGQPAYSLAQGQAS